METEISQTERDRLFQMSVWERKFQNEGYRFIGGIDEVGRGCLAGPVVAVCCILPDEFLLQDLNDSKKIIPQKRRKLFEILVHQKNVIYGVGLVDHQVIDKINIHQATHLAMKKAVSVLPFFPDIIIVDGKQIPSLDFPVVGIIKGDSLSISIAAASIIAKETRDQMMVEYHKRWPQYGFAQHKGYATKNHREAITLYGPCPIHRRSFEPIRSYLFS